MPAYTTSFKIIPYQTSCAKETSSPVYCQSLHLFFGCAKRSCAAHTRIFGSLTSKRGAAPHFPVRRSFAAPLFMTNVKLRKAAQLSQLGGKSSKVLQLLLFNNATAGG